MADPHARDKRLAGRIAAGDRRACAELIERCYEDIYRLVLRLCRNVHDAEDLVQETFAKCWTSIGAYSAQASLGTWLRQIAYHSFIDWHRRTAAQRRESITENLIETTFPMDASPAARLEADEQARQVARALDELDDAGRHAVTLHYLHGMSLQEVADLLEQPLGTVKWRISKALAQMRDRLNSHKDYADESRE